MKGIDATLMRHAIETRANKVHEILLHFYGIIKYEAKCTKAHKDDIDNKNNNNDHDDDDGNKSLCAHRVQGKMSDWNEKNPSQSACTNSSEIVFSLWFYLNLDLNAVAMNLSLTHTLSHTHKHSRCRLLHHGLLLGKESKWFIRVRERTIVSTKNAMKRKKRFAENIIYSFIVGGCCRCCRSYGLYCILCAQVRLYNCTRIDAR